MANKAFWAVTSYFNPSGYKVRLKNYKIFRRHLNIPLITVELSFDGKFELESSDADILIRIKGKDIMWQQWRLLNIAFQYLPEECEKVAWVDCDIIFAKQDWSEKANNLLDKYKLIQPFKKLYHLPPLTFLRDETYKQVQMPHSRSFKEYSFAFCSVNKTLPAKLKKLKEKYINGFRGKATGVIWAIRKEVVLKHKLYDACIAGGGDRAIAFAAVGRMQKIQNCRPLNKMQIKHYLEWAESFYSSIKNEISYVDCDLYHLWHGSFENRNYGKRHKILKQLNFNPYTDIKTDKNGCWQWSHDNTELRKFLSSYFSFRNEDAIR